MIVTIHQPHYLPWLGYLHRMAEASLFVVLDHVQFERGNYQNRTQILMDGSARWLTVPVVQRSQKERIVDKQLDGWPETAKKHFLSLRHAYRAAPHLAAYAAELRRLYDARWERLADLDDALLGFLRDALGIRTPLVKSSALGVDGAKSGLILNVCKAVGARRLLVGLGGSRRYLDRDAFAAEGIAIVEQQFTHPVYPQCGGGAFTPGLSAVDLLFNCGPASRARLLAGAAHPLTHDARAAA